MPIQIILKISPQKTENFQIKKKNPDIFQISAQNIDCGYSLELPQRGGSNEYPQSMFLSRDKKNNVYPCKPHFYYIKVGFKGVKIIKACFLYGLYFHISVYALKYPSLALSNIQRDRPQQMGVESEQCHRMQYDASFWPGSTILGN